MTNSIHIRKKLSKALDKAVKLNEKATPDTGIDLCRALLFILDKYNKGNYYGTVALKFTGLTVQNPREVEVTHRLEVEIPDGEDQST